MMIMNSKDTTICVVDAVPDDYRTLLSSMEPTKGRMTFLPSGRAALRVNPQVEPDLWIINIELPDMSGLDLYSMIRGRYPGVPVCLVADRYSTDDEVRARTSGATMYFCKPLRSEWFIGRRAHEQTESE